MADKVIEVKLSEKGIQSLIDQLEKYRQNFEAKVDRFRQLVAERIRWTAQEGFSWAITSDIFVGAEPPPSDVTVTVEEDGDVSIVIAHGEEAVFIEFGAGIYYNGPAGQSPHPWGENNNFRIGEYDKGFGKRNVWPLPGSTHEMPILTHGTPAAMPMYWGVQEVVAGLADLAKEVFGSD